MHDAFTSHDDQIRDQFTRQAEAFAAKPEHSDADVQRLIERAVGLSQDDHVLDVACGPGLVACEFARTARQVCGIDITPAMIAKATERARSAGQGNLSWQVGSAIELPFPPETFSLVFTRYSFHHLLHPERALAEMVRVCRPGGRVAVVDVYVTSAEQAAAYDQVERLRDPSHVSALALDRLQGMFAEQRLADVRTIFYRLEMDLEELLASSCPQAGAQERIRAIFAADLAENRLGMNAQLVAGRIRFSFPVAIVRGVK